MKKLMVSQFRLDVADEYGEDIASKVVALLPSTTEIEFKQGMDALDRVLPPPIYPSFGRTNSQSDDGEFEYKKS